MLSRSRFVAPLAAAPLAAFGGFSAAGAQWPQRPVRNLSLRGRKLGRPHRMAGRPAT